MSQLVPPGNRGAVRGMGPGFAGTGFRAWKSGTFSTVVR